MARWIALRLLLVAIGICIPIFGAKLLERVLRDDAGPSPALRAPADR